MQCAVRGSQRKMSLQSVYSVLYLLVTGSLFGCNIHTNVWGFFSGGQSGLTFFQLSVPHFDDEGRVFAVVDDPQRQSLDALLRAAQLRQLLLQGGLREGRHAGE